MPYLRRHDFKEQIRDSELSVLETHPKALEEATKAAIERARGHLDYHYDAAQIFIDVPAWDPSDTYDEGDVVSLEAEEWKAGKQYNTEDLVEFKGKVYEALAQVSGEEPDGSSNFDEAGDSDTIYVAKSDGISTYPKDTSDWKEEDPRHAYIKMIVIDIALYNLYSMTQPDNIPEYRMQRKEEGVEYLEKLASLKLSANLPERLPNDDQADEAPSYGGFPNKQWNY